MSWLAELDLSTIILLCLAALCIGISKSGLAGLSMVHVIVFAFVFGTRASTGVLLPLLIVGDVLAVYFLGCHVQWNYVRKLLPSSMIGVVLGTMLMGRLDEGSFRPLVGAIILTLTCIQILRIWKPDWFDKVPHSPWFAWTMGTTAGVTTMVANAAGPVIALYLLAISLPKKEFVGTSAWFFLILNLFKVPFSFGLGLILPETLLLDLVLAPCILVGLLFGRWFVAKISQRWFNVLLLIFTGIASLRLLGLF